MSAVKTGKTIESIAYKKSGVALVLSDGEKLTLTPDSFTEMPLYEGKTLSEDDLDAICEEFQYLGSYSEVI